MFYIYIYIYYDVKVALLVKIAQLDRSPGTAVVPSVQGGKGFFPKFIWQEIKILFTISKLFKAFVVYKRMHKIGIL